jgi:ribonuclease Y
MDIVTILVTLLLAGGAGAGGFLYASTKFKREASDAEARARKIIADAEEHAHKAERRAREADEARHKTLELTNKEAAETRTRAEKLLEEIKNEEKELKVKLESSEKRLLEKETNIDKKLDELDKRKLDLESKTKEIETKKQEADKVVDEQKKKLEQVAGLSREEAKAELIAKVEKDASDELVKRIREAEEKAKDEADKKARNIIAGAIQRFASEVAAESTVTLVSIPSDDVKGRIIGREGRNITAFEMATGVDVIVDDTPGVVIISGFDLVRRNIAKITLEKLISDGRIHPARIEEAVKKATAEIDKLMKEYGDKAVLEVGVVGLPPPLVKLLGRLNYRTSYGQNNLRHSIEVASIGAMLASELGADVKIAKAACLLHDIGKAVDHEIEGPHAVLGAEILRKFQVAEPIIHAVEAHHEDVEPKTVEAFIVQAADAISGARPGARRESMENYVQRLQELEAIATGFPGVDKAFAIQAGREVRVLVRPEDIDDLTSVKLAKEIAAKIEKEMAYPGQIKVNVIRETRAVDYAK